MAEVAFAVKDEWHDRGVGEAPLSYLTCLGKRKELPGFDDVQAEGSRNRRPKWGSEAFNLQD